MPRILDNLTVLEKLIKRKPLGLITDIDGTICPTIPNLLEAKIPETIRQLLLALSKKLALVAVISGRQSSEVKDMVDIEGVTCIGHYGMEVWQNGKAVLHPDAQPYVPAVRALVKEIESLKSIEGVVIQDKWATVSVIYRQSPNPEYASKAIINLLFNSPNAKQLRIMGEKMIFGIVPPIDINKGTAVTDLVRLHHLHAGIFLGDDIGDIPAFRAIRRKGTSFHGLAIAVVTEETPEEVISKADFVLDGVQETEILLKWLVTHYNTFFDRLKQKW